MSKYNIFALILVMVVVSLIGFCVENVFISFSVGYMNNRNMVLPFLWGYGLGILALLLLFGTPDAPRFISKELNFASPIGGIVYYFCVSFVCVSLGEMILGHLIEYTCDIIWWDYTRLPLSITKYTSVPTSLGFASLITVFMKHCFEPLISAFSRMNPQALRVLAICFVVALSIDMLNSLLYMITNHNTLEIWRITFSNNPKTAIKALFLRNC